MTSFNFQNGGDWHGILYPPLKSIEAAIVGSTRNHDNTIFYLYEPGNMTRYEVIFTTYQDLYGNDILLMSLVCPKRATMIIPDVKSVYGMYDLGYLQEKLGLNVGDCYALIQLINHHNTLMEH